MIFAIVQLSIILSVSGPHSSSIVMSLLPPLLQSDLLMKHTHKLEKLPLNLKLCSRSKRGSAVDLVRGCWQTCYLCLFFLRPHFFLRVIYSYSQNTRSLNSYLSDTYLLLITSTKQVSFYWLCFRVVEEYSTIDRICSAHRESDTNPVCYVDLFKLSLKNVGCVPNVLIKYLQ